MEELQRAVLAQSQLAIDRVDALAEADHMDQHAARTVIEDIGSIYKVVDNAVKTVEQKREMERLFETLSYDTAPEGTLFHPDACIGLFDPEDG